MLANSIPLTKQALAHLCFDLASKPSDAEALRQEILSIYMLDGGLDAMRRLRLLDSFLTESARLNPIGITTDRAYSIGLSKCFLMLTVVAPDQELLVFYSKPHSFCEERLCALLAVVHVQSSYGNFLG